MRDGELIGRVSGIWRHPVQSMRGERRAGSHAEILMAGRAARGDPVRLVD